MEKKTGFRPCGECSGCVCFGFCTEIAFPIVTDDQLDNPDWLRDARIFASSLAISGALWVSEIFDMHSRMPMRVSIKVDGKTAILEALPVGELFLPSDDTIDDGRAPQYMESLRCWCRDFLDAPIPHDITPYVTTQRREHARIVLTLIAMHNPEAYMKWVSGSK